MAVCILACILKHHFVHSCVDSVSDFLSYWTNIFVRHLFCSTEAEADAKKISGRIGRSGNLPT